MPFGPLADLAPRNEALQRAAAKEEFLKSQKPGFVQRLFGGADDPRLSGEQNAEARRQAVLRGGFSGLMAAGQGANPFSTIGAIGSAAQDYRQLQNEQVGEANLDLSPALDLDSQIVELIRDGEKHRVLINKADGSEIADLGLSEAPADPTDLRTPIKVRLPSGDEVFAFPDLKRGVLVSADTGEILVGATPIQVEPNLGKRKVIDPEGNEYEFLFDPKTGEMVEGTMRPTGLPTGDDDDDLSLARTIEGHIDTMTMLLSPRGMKPYGLLETEAAKRNFFRAFTRAEVQIFNAAAQDILSLVIRSRSGAQASEKEVARLNAFAIPLPGDEPATVKFKLQLMRNVASDLRRGKDPYDRVRDPSRADGLRPVPFNQQGQLTGGAHTGPFSHLTPEGKE